MNDFSIDRLRRLPTLVLLLSLNVIPVAADAQQWHVQVWPDNPDYIQVTVDTRGLRSNVRLSKVVVDVSFFDGTAKRIASPRFAFTDKTLPSLVPNKAYQRFFAHAARQAVRVEGNHLSSDHDVAGERADTPPRPARKEALRGVTPKVVGPQPPKAIPPQEE